MLKRVRSTSSTSSTSPRRGSPPPPPFLNLLEPSRTFLNLIEASCTFLSKKVQEGSRRVKKVQEGSRRFKMAQECSTRFKNSSTVALVLEEGPGGRLFDNFGEVFLAISWSSHPGASHRGCLEASPGALINAVWTSRWCPSTILT